MVATYIYKGNILIISLAPAPYHHLSLKTPAGADNYFLENKQHWDQPNVLFS